jgi:hypothetical protein
MAKIFEWKDAIRTKPRKGNEHLVLLWLHDLETNVSFMFDEACYWDGDRWMRFDPIDARSQPLTNKMIVVQWCYVPKSRMGLYKHPGKP